MCLSGQTFALISLGVYLGVEFLGHRVASLVEIAKYFSEEIVPIYALSAVWFPVAILRQH